VILLSAVYAVVVGPSVWIGRLFGARLIDLRPGRRPAWTARRHEERDPRWLERQF
jgi:hypothetical protein